MIKTNHARIFTKTGPTAEILTEAIACIPPKTKIYVVGGAARNAIYYDLFKKALPQRDYDLLLIGNKEKFVSNLRQRQFIYGNIRRKNDVVLMKKIVPNPQSVIDYLVLDIHRDSEPSILKNLKNSSAFIINGFAIPLADYLAADFRTKAIALPGAMNDLKNHRLRLNLSGYKKHSGNLFACLRFMSLGFKAPKEQEVKLLLEQLPNLEAWRFERNVKKVFNYVGGEKPARQLLRRLGIKIDVFNIDKLRRE